MKSGNLILLEPTGPVQACNGIDLPFTFCVWKRSRVYVTQKNDVHDEVKEEVKPELGVTVSAIQKLPRIPREYQRLLIVVLNYTNGLTAVFEECVTFTDAYGRCVWKSV